MESTKNMRSRRNVVSPPKKIDIRALLVTIVLLSGILVALVLMLNTSGCAGITRLAPAGVPTCDEMEQHIVNIGCDTSVECRVAVAAVKGNILARVPEGVDFNSYCQLALTALPYRCALSAKNPEELLDCVE